MAKRVVVIASGETERRALPLLLSQVAAEGVFLDSVLVPPRNGRLDARTAERLIWAHWYSNVQSRPDKFVILADTDGKSPDRVRAELKERLSARLGDIAADVLYAYAQWHLEAWYFGDDAGLRGYVGRALGSVDASKPDEIQNPKLHLKKLLGNRTYTARVSEEIAGRVNATTIAQRSPSFQGLLDAVANGRSMRMAADAGETKQQ